MDVELDNYAGFRFDVMVTWESIFGEDYPTEPEFSRTVAKVKRATRKEIRDEFPGAIVNIYTDGADYATFQTKIDALDEARLREEEGRIYDTISWIVDSVASDPDAFLI